MSTVPSGTRFIGIAESVNLTERKSAGLNSETQPYTIEDLAATVGVGAQGPQGVQGPAGPLGPVGPAGLNWQGTWVSGTSYVADDAVGYNGASWFCILATSGTSNPSVDTTHWALLASQGAQGIQGVQGPTGPQGLGASQTLQQTVDLGNSITSGDFSSRLLASFIEVGKISTDENTRLTSSYLSISNGINNARLSLPITLTANRIITFPDASGTVALTSDIISTFGSLEIENISPYQILSYNLNSITTTGATDKVVLPTSAPIGKIVYVFAMNNSNSFTVRGNQSGSALISPNGIAAQTSSIAVAPNTSYQFISLGGGYWKSSQII